ncbi:RNA 2',3'-cyclic phosphodiesterase [archaeon CG_4_10_14_0_2_um_filter_Archaea_38_6]|nr:MAG: RNA 2',3'-cyclic phosphodiesterase [archaeon CG06_land_8_20_14_3_00_37_11]PJA22444.1 MAG: RNA 2',3'-cyclic phosphodiesterase [archaeon CG_4_10_14_0_2_um_filter_Archaea_38_6]
MRCFFAVEIPENARQSVEELMCRYGNVRFIPASNLHITLKFMGEIEDVDELIRCAEKVKHEFFSVKLSGIDAFPDKVFPRILWIGVGEGNVGLFKLSQELGRHVSRFGVDNSGFVSHLTIARIKEKFSDAEIFSERFESEHFIVKNFVLMKSILNSSGAEYEVVKSFSLI